VSARPPGNAPPPGPGGAGADGRTRVARSRHQRGRPWLLFLVALVVIGMVVAIVVARAGPPGLAELYEAIRDRWWPSAEPPPPPPPALHVEGLAGEPGGLNPLLWLEAPTQQVAALLFSGLTRLDGYGHVLPDLAMSWEASGDNRTWTFRLRSGAVWHDGQSVTARDVTFTINSLASADFPGDLAGEWRGFRATYPDDMTVVVELPVADAAFPVKAAVPVLPRHLLSGVAFRLWYEHGFNREPVGSGPFMLVAWADGQELTLTANPSHHLGAPSLETLVLRFGAGPEAAGAGVAAGLGAAAFTGAAAVAGGVVDPAAVVALADRPDLTLQRGPGNVAALLVVNQRRVAGEDAVRQAMATVLDLAAVAQAAHMELAAAGLAAPVGRSDIAPLLLVGGMAVPGSPGAAGQGEARAADPDQARRLLADGGWRAGSPDGTLMRDGEALRLELLLPQGRPDLAAAGRELCRQLTEIGIEASARTVSGAEYLAAWAPPFDFDLLLLELASEPSGDEFWQLLHTGQAPVRGPQGVLRGGANIGGVADQELDALLAELAVTPLMAADRRAHLYQTVSARLAERAHLVVLWREAMFYAAPPRLAGPAPGPFGVYWNTHLWHWR